LSSIYFLGYKVAQDQFQVISLAFGLAFTGYFCGLYFNHKHGLSWKYLLGLAVVCRILLLFAEPTLSDDIYRFLWDGHLIHKGINPLSQLPSELVVGPQSDHYLTFLFPHLNSPDYYTIYPPISQAIFYISTVAELSFEQSVFFMKFILFAFECLSLFLIYKLLLAFNIKRDRILIYALNPLIIVEITGNLHFEGVMICFLLACIYFLYRQRYVLGGVALAGSVAAKLLPLMFIPALFFWLRKQGDLIKFSLGFVLASFLLFIPFFLSLDFQQFFSSLDLYFQKFEFNASVYYLTRYLGELLTGYNQIKILGPLLSLIALGSILWKSRKAATSSLKELMPIFLYSFLFYLIFATTVHPWYLSIPIVLTVFYRNTFVLIWSAVIILSYATYEHPNFEQPMGLIAFEYALVFMVFVYERMRLKKSIG